MQALQLVSPRSNRLRFVFGSNDVSLRLSPDATFEDVAVRFGSLVTKHIETPLGIDVTFAEMAPSRPSLFALSGSNGHPGDASYAGRLVWINLSISRLVSSILRTAMVLTPISRTGASLPPG